MGRVLAIWLDGFDVGLADTWGLEALCGLVPQSAHAVLDPGLSYRTGLAGEHLSTGLDPAASGRASAVHFDPATYSCEQRGTTFRPVLGDLPSVVLDPCYFDLAAARPNVLGLTDWGAHDPGSVATARPAGLEGEVNQRFGPSGRRWTYATPWASISDCEQMGVDLAAAVRRRTEIASWLLGERLPDWQIAMIGVAEAHSATEGLFHGVDPSPRWQSCPSRPAAEHALRSVYEAIDELVGKLTSQFADSVQVVFALHGMGANSSDVPSMLLLGELLSRWSGHPTPDLNFPLGPDGIPFLPPGVLWGDVAATGLGSTPSRRGKALGAAPSPVRRIVRRVRAGRSGSTLPPGSSRLNWMPLMRHQAKWSTMRAFALPSFYDGRVRVNLCGREALGCVALDDYQAVLDEVEETLGACRDPLLEIPVVKSFERPFEDPMSAGSSDADLIITWADGVLGIGHPDLGTIGPVPPRRTGGHAPVGRCLVRGAGIDPVDLGLRSSFDVLPTVLRLADGTASWELSGQPMPVSVGQQDEPLGHAPQRDRAPA